MNRLVEEYGFQREELTGKRLFDFVVTDHRPRAMADFKVLRGGKRVKGEMEVLTPKGVVWVEYRDNPIFRGDQVVGVQAILTDVTKRQRAERRLREERDRAQRYLDIAGVMLVIIDTEERVGLINKKGCEILGCAEEDMLGKNWFDNFTPPRVRERTRAIFAGLLAGRADENEYAEGVVLAQDGRERIVGWHNTILRDETGRIIGTLSSGEDITRRRQAEEAYRSLVDHSLQGLLLFQEGKAVFANQAMAEITGYTIDEMRALPAEQVRNFIHPEDRERVWQNQRRRLAGEAVPEHYEMRGIRKDGSVCWLDLHASRIDYRGKPAIQAAYIDITERKQAEEALRLSEERYRGIFENAVLGMYQTTPDGEILTANPALVRMLGYDTFEQLASRNLEEEGYDPEHPRSLFQERIEANGQVVGLESAWKRRDGSTVWARESARVARDETGKTLFYEGTVEDITERKHADQLMRTLATAAMELVELPAEADLFQFIAEKVLALIGAGIVSVNSIEGDTLTVRQITGATTVAMKLAQRLLGKAVIGMPLKGVHEVARTDLLTGKLMKVEGGLYELLLRTVPRPACWTLEKAVGIQECHSIGLRRPKRLLGSVTILSQKATELNTGVIEAFVNQASVALERRRAEEALRESEEQLRSLFENSLDAALLTIPEGGVLAANAAACRMFGRTEEELRRVGRLGVVDVTDPRLAPALEERARTGRFRGELTFLRKDGTKFPAEISSSVFTDQHGQARTSMFIRDITERKRAEEELRRSERRETILNRIANAFLTVGDDRMYEEVLAIVLETMESKFGVFGFIADNGDLVIPTMTREIWADCQVPGKSMVFPPATWVNSLWGRALQEQKGFCSNGPFHTPPGHIPIDSFLTTPIVFGDRTIGLLSVANRTGGYTAADQDLLHSIADYFSPVLNARLERDRQERQRGEAERKLRESEVKYRELFENAREAIVIFNLEKTITDVNKFVETYGFRQEDLIGRNYLEFVAEPYREKAIEDFELLRQGVPLEGEFEVMTPKGQVTVYYKDSPIVRGGAVVGVQSILLDVTQRRRAEEALRKSEARYRLLANHASDIIWTTDLKPAIDLLQSLRRTHLGVYAGGSTRPEGRRRLDPGFPCLGPADPGRGDGNRENRPGGPPALARDRGRGDSERWNDVVGGDPSRLPPRCQRRGAWESSASHATSASAGNWNGRSWCAKST